MIKYQDTILNWISSQSLANFPKTILIEGSRGSGKHSLCNYIASTFNIELKDITDSISLDTINSTYLEVLPKLYLIDSSMLTEKQENTILKFLEEPPMNSIIAVLCEHKNTLLETIQNRCYKISLKVYSTDELLSFCSCDDYLELRVILADTPGEMLALNSCNISEMINLCNLIIDKIAIASISNTLTLSNKIAFKGEEDKFDFEMFVKLLTKICFDKIVDKSVKSDIISVIINLYNDSKLKNVDKKTLYENFLLNLRRRLRNEH